jgi:hypothetical protein
MVFWVCSSILVYAQNPSVILQAKQYPSDNQAAPGESSYAVEDWLHSNVVDMEGNIASAGFIYEEYDNIYGPQRRKFPSILKTSGDLNYIDEVQYEKGYQKTSSGTFLEWTIEDANCVFQEIHEVVGEGYVAIGSGNFKRSGVKYTRAFLVYLNYDLTPKIQGPRVYDLGTSITSRFYGVRHYRENGNVKFIVSGVKDSKLCIWKIDANGDINSSTPFSYTLDNTSANIKGTFRGMCLSFPDGSLPDGNPKIANQSPDKILATGFALKYDGSNYVNDEDAVLATFDINLNQLNYIFFDSDVNVSTGPNQAGYETAAKSRFTFFDALHSAAEFPKYNWPCPQMTDYTGSFYVNNLHINPNPGNPDFLKNCDRGHSIEQNMAGDGYVLSTAAHYSLITKSNLCTQRAGLDQHLSTESVLHAIRIDGANNFILDDVTHLAHLSGSDFYHNARLDYDGNIYITSSIADDGIVLDNSFGNRFKNSMFLLAAKISQNGSGVFAINKSWHRAFYGGSGDLAGPSSQGGAGCSFDVAINKNNEVIAVGNNHTDHENWDLIKFSDDCIPNDPLLPVPDIVANQGTYTYSLATAMGNVPGVKTWGSSKIVKAQVVIESGYTLRIPIHQYNRIQFYDVRYLEDNQQANNAYQSDAGVIIMPGGRLELLNGAELTALDNTSCFSTWGGVDVGTQIVYGAYPAELEMENSTISNATVGVSVYDGYIDAYNNSQQSPSVVGLYADIIGDQFTPPNPIGNFVNNNISIFHNSASASWSVTPGYTERYSLLKFLCEDKTSYCKGLDYFVKYQGHQNNSYYNNLYSHLKFEGCEFKNTYFTNLGMCAGISSFGGSLDVMFGVLDPAATTEECKPIATRNSKFIGLYSGIKNGYTNHGRSTRFRVAEAEFDNNREAIIDGVGKNSLIYKNNIHWDDYVYPFDGTNDTKLGVYNSWGWGTKILENEIYNSLDENFLAIYTSQNAWHSGYGGENVRLNRIENASIAPYLGTGHKISSDNTEMQITCNTYIGLYNDWFVTGPLANQGSPAEHNANDWSSWGGNPFSDIDGTVNTSFIYRSPDPNGPPNIYAAQFTNSPLVVEVIGPFPSSGITCPVLDPCLVYDKDETEWDIIASQPQQTDPIDDVLDDLFSGRTDEVQVALNSLEFEGVYNKMDDLIATLMPASSEKRLYRLNGKEIAKLKSLATESSFTGQLAVDVLFHFADTRTALDTYTGERKVINEQYVETAANKEINKLAQVRLFPNPASKNLTIVTSENEDYTAQVLDLNGKAIFTFEGHSNTQVDISSLAKGMYFIQIKTEDGQTAHKLIVD